MRLSDRYEAWRLPAWVRSSWRIAGVATVFLAVVLILLRLEPHAGEPATGEGPGSGIVLDYQVTAVWIPRPLHEALRQTTDSPADWSAEAVNALAARIPPKAAWFALTYQGLQVNGASEDVVQVRRLSEVEGRLAEFRDVAAAVQGPSTDVEEESPPRPRVRVVPDSLLDMAPVQAITRWKSGAIPEDADPE